MQLFNAYWMSSKQSSPISAFYDRFPGYRLQLLGILRFFGDALSQNFKILKMNIQTINGSGRQEHPMGIVHPIKS